MVRKTATGIRNHWFLLVNETCPNSPDQPSSVWPQRERARCPALLRLIPLSDTAGSHEESNAQPGKAGVDEAYSCVEESHYNADNTGALILCVHDGRDEAPQRVAIKSAGEHGEQSSPNDWRKT
jgi:hypothetical protein